MHSEDLSDLDLEDRPRFGPSRRPEINQLKAVALSHGGKRFQTTMVLEEEFTPSEARKLITQGRIMSGRNPIMMKGSPSGCHDNVVALYQSNRGKVIPFTGLALTSDDGIWRVHSWATTLEGRIIETTERRTKYFGVPARIDFDGRITV